MCSLSPEQAALAVLPARLVLFAISPADPGSGDFVPILTLFVTARMFAGDFLVIYKALLFHCVLMSTALKYS